jgi:hypothetical protein
MKEACWEAEFPAVCVASLKDAEGLRLPFFSSVAPPFFKQQLPGLV